MKVNRILVSYSNSNTNRDRVLASPVNFKAGTMVDTIALSKAHLAEAKNFETQFASDIVNQGLFKGVINKFQNFWKMIVLTDVDKRKAEELRVVLAQIAPYAK